MKFVLGIAVGAMGMWAYQNGKLQSFMGSAPDSMQQMWQPAVQQLNKVAQSQPVQQATSRVQSATQQMGSSDIARPTPTEISGRPSEPLPSQGA